MSSIALFTSEAVSEGHPDKVADQISDAVVDRVLTLDPSGKAAIETLIGPGFVVVAGEVSLRTPELTDRLRADVPELVHEVLRAIGYDGLESGFDPATAAIQVRIGAQSREIRDKVERADGDLGAGDQGLMFGYACDETPERMPAAIHLARALMARQAAVRRAGRVPWLLPDAKSQVTVAYRDGALDGVQAVVVSTQHRRVDRDALVAGVLRHIVDPVVPEALRRPGFEVLVNPGGEFTLGGPAADCGVTGRKIIADTYGGSCPHGGGAFSGKDPTKVDRSAAYAARWVAKHVVAAGLARRCTVQVAYAIGQTRPISVHVDAHGTGVASSGRLTEAVRQVFDLSPAGIIRALDLRRPLYGATAARGHFTVDLPWEATPHQDALRRAVGGTGGAA